LLAISKESLAESEFLQDPEALFLALPKNIELKTTFKLFWQKLQPITNNDIAQHENGGTLVQVLRSNMKRNLSHIQKSLEEAVNRSVSYCYFTTPYFLPHEPLRKAIINAQKRGVDVQILTAGISDMPLMRYASHHVYDSFLHEGIRIFEMTKKTLHAKLASIDGLYASIGSFNLDHWSARRNLEVTLTVIDRDIALDLKKQFNKDLSLGHEIKQQDFKNRSVFKRFFCWLAYLLMRL
jgi:cardiolipin synthase A/B